MRKTTIWSVNHITANIQTEKTLPKLNKTVFKEVQSQHGEIKVDGNSPADEFHPKRLAFQDRRPNRRLRPLTKIGEKIKKRPLEWARSPGFSHIHR